MTCPGTEGNTFVRLSCTGRIEVAAAAAKDPAPDRPASRSLEYRRARNQRQNSRAQCEQLESQACTAQVTSHLPVSIVRTWSAPSVWRRR